MVLIIEGNKNLVEYSTRKYFNPSSLYQFGAKNFKDIIETKKLVCKQLGVDFKNNIIFTGSATEASNLAIMGSYRKSFKKMIFSIGEHPSVYNTALGLKTKNDGVEIEFIRLSSNGEIDYAHLEEILSEGQVDFISIMQVSNETGAIKCLYKISKLRRKYAPNAILHIDGVQAFGKIKTNLNDFDIDFYTISAHKLHGPKGLGVLYAKNPAKLVPQMLGGGQEFNIRSGTENLASIMAFKIALEKIDPTNQTYNRIIDYKRQFISYLKENVDSKIKLKFVDNQNSSPYIVSLAIVGIKGETLLYMCEENGVLISNGSACSSKKSGNRILQNMGYTKEEIEGSVRISFSNLTTQEEIINGAKIITNCINELYKKLN